MELSIRQKLAGMFPDDLQIKAELRSASAAAILEKHDLENEDTLNAEKLKNIDDTGDHNNSGIKNKAKNIINKIFFLFIYLFFLLRPNYRASADKNFNYKQLILKYSNPWY